MIKNLRFLRWLMCLIVAFSCAACEKISNKALKLKNKLNNTPTNTEYANLPTMVVGIETILDVAYGAHPKQKVDIYLPENANNAPIIVMMHGGGWTSGDKRGLLAYVNKVNRWGPKGFIFVSVGTRLMPEADVYTQLQDLTQAVVSIQKHASEWGGNPEKLILMGHSSGGTLVATLSAKPSLVTDLGGKRWLGTILLDASSLDIERTMRLWSHGMFTYAYGKDTKKWSIASPYALIDTHAIPFFIACSTFRPDNACEQAELFKEKASQLNIRVDISRQKLNHGEINDHLGLNNDFTQSIEAFMRSLDANVAQLLQAD